MAYDGLVLAGGAARGAAFLGALDELRPCLGEVKVVAGSSIGALAAVLFAQGGNLRDVVEAIAGRPFELQFDLDSMDSTFGLDNGAGLLSFIRSLVGTRTFGELQKATGKEVVICATNCLTSKPEYFGPRSHNAMEVAWAVRLSCTLPFLFGYGINGDIAYVDGGVSDNFPVDAAALYGCQHVLGLRFRQPEPTARPTEIFQFVLILMASMAWQAEPKDHLCARVVELDVDPGSALDFSMAAETLLPLYEAGQRSIVDAKIVAS